MRNETGNPEDTKNLTLKEAFNYPGAAFAYRDAWDDSGKSVKGLLTLEMRSKNGRINPDVALDYKWILDIAKKIE